MNDFLVFNHCFIVYKFDISYNYIVLFTQHIYNLPVLEKPFYHKKKSVLPQCKEMTDAQFQCPSAFYSLQL